MMISAIDLLGGGFDLAPWELMGGVGFGDSDGGMVIDMDNMGRVML